MNKKLLQVDLFTLGKQTETSLRKNETSLGKKSQPTKKEVAWIMSEKIKQTSLIRE